MKSIIIYLLVLTTIVANAQDNNALLNNTSNTVLTSANGSYGVTMHVKNPRRQVDGSVYLFDNWENTSIIITTDNQHFRINNINLNVDRNVFESKFSNDSIFAFSFNNIDRFIINDRVYKNFYWDDDNRVYQVLVETNDFMIIKGFKVSLVEGSANPMLARSRDKYVMKETYYIKKGNSFKYFRLSKGNILDLIKLDKEKKRELMNYVDTYNLSFKEEADLDKIFSFALNTPLNNHTQFLEDITTLESTVNLAIDNKFRPYGIAMRKQNNFDQMDGSAYLLEEWNNEGVIYTTDNKQLILNNINLNVDKNIFESRFSEDSIFSFSFNKIEKFVVNDRVFKNFYWEDDNRVYEVLFDSSEFKIIKGFKTSIIVGSANPMLNRSRDRYVMKETYYVQKENSIDQFKLNRNSVIDLINPSKEEKKILMNFIESKNLSFKEDKDIQDIFSFSLKNDFINP